MLTDSVQARVLMTNCLLMFDVIVRRGDNAKDVKESIRDVLGWPRSYNFEIHCAPENDGSRWLGAMRASVLELMEGQREAAQRLTGSRTLVTDHTPIYDRLDPLMETIVQLVVVAPNHPKPARFPGFDIMPVHPLEHANHTDRSWASGQAMLKAGVVAIAGTAVILGPIWWEMRWGATHVGGATLLAVAVGCLVWWKKNRVALR